MADYKEISNAIWNSYLQYLPTARIGDAAGTLHAAKKDLNECNRINYDNYYHRLGMCMNAQKGIDSALYSFGGGLLNEAKDIIKKSWKAKDVEKPWLKSVGEILKDSGKDIVNNFESSAWGLTNPNGNCIMWLNDLDVDKNQWKKNWKYF